jgi:DNA phosphorothioation-dependent restriction protein DptG
MLFPWSGVAGISILRSSGELMAAAMAATGRMNRRWPESSLCYTRIECQLSDLRSMAQIRRYPFAGNLFKETLKFLETNPQSLAHSRELRFHIWKAYFQPVKSKIRFQQFTVLPLELF